MLSVLIPFHSLFLYLFIELHTYYVITIHFVKQITNIASIIRSAISMLAARHTNPIEARKK